MTPFQWFLAVVVVFYVGRDAFLFFDELRRRRRSFELALSALRGAEERVREEVAS